jgi:hypothetical protein
LAPDPTYGISRESSLPIFLICISYRIYENGDDDDDDENDDDDDDDDDDCLLYYTISLIDFKVCILPSSVLKISI